MSKMSCGDAIAQSLVEHGVDTVFGLPGAQVYGLFDAFYRAGDQLKVIGARHEQATAYMACGYSKSSGKVGVCAVVPGPGVLNAGAGLSIAYGSNLPVLCLTGQVPSEFLGIGRGHLHEMPDQLATLRSFLKDADRIDHPSQASTIMADAFCKMQTGRMGPVAVETPWDIFGVQGEVPGVPPYVHKPSIAPDSDEVDRVVKMIARARRPMIAVGGGAIAAQESIVALAERLNAPVMAFRSGRGIMPEDAELGLTGVAGFDLWDDIDLVIGVGSRLELTHLRWPYRPEGQQLIRIDIDPRELVRLKPDIGLVADAVLAVPAVLEGLEQCDVAAQDQRDSVHAAKANAEKRIASVKPYSDYLSAIRDVMPRDGIFVKDLCQAGYTSYYAFPVYQPRTYITSGYQGTLGHAFNTALGAKVANPSKPVVSVNGDGGFLFGVQELATAVQYGINAVSIVFDNNAYGNVRRDQQHMYDGRIIGSELQNPDLVKMAESYGAAGYRVTSPGELRPVLERALAANLPSVVQIPVDAQAESNPWPLLHPARK